MWQKNPDATHTLLYGMSNACSTQLLHKSRRVSVCDLSNHQLWYVMQLYGDAWHAWCSSLYGKHMVHHSAWCAAVLWWNVMSSAAAKSPYSTVSLRDSVLAKKERLIETAQLTECMSYRGVTVQRSSNAWSIPHQLHLAGQRTEGVSWHASHQHHSKAALTSWLGCGCR